MSSKGDWVEAVGELCFILSRKYRNSTNRIIIDKTLQLIVTKLQQRLKKFFLAMEVGKGEQNQKLCQASLDGRTDGRTDVRTDGWMNGRTNTMPDKWADGQTDN